jgi:uncharacterized protein (TIGR02996 family)
MNEDAWIAAMRSNPHCLVTMGAFADWLQEQDDPRWEAMAVLVDTGSDREILGRHRRTEWVSKVAEYLKHVPCSMFAEILKSVDVHIRVAMLNAYRYATLEQRSEYLREFREACGHMENK